MDSQYGNRFCFLGLKKNIHNAHNGRTIKERYIFERNIINKCSKQNDDTDAVKKYEISE